MHYEIYVNFFVCIFSLLCSFHFTSHKKLTFCEFFNFDLCERINVIDFCSALFLKNGKYFQKKNAGKEKKRKNKYKTKPILIFLAEQESIINMKESGVVFEAKQYESIYNKSHHKYVWCTIWNNLLWYIGNRKLFDICIYVEVAGKTAYAFRTEHTKKYVKA